MTRDEKLAELVSIVTGILFGMPGYDQRLSELGGGFPAGSGSGNVKGSVGKPVEAQVIATMDERRGDPADQARSDFDKRLLATLREAEALWSEYRRISQPRMGVSKVADPGCELCNQVPDHWCQTFATVEVTSTAKRRGHDPTVRRVRLCSWCYQFARPNRANRMPTLDEVGLHAQGKRVRWKVGA